MKRLLNILGFALSTCAILAVFENDFGLAVLCVGVAGAIAFVLGIWREAK